MPAAAGCNRLPACPCREKTGPGPKKPANMLILIDSNYKLAVTKLFRLPDFPGQY
jgi:hypothetical protein